MQFLFCLFLRPSFSFNRPAIPKGNGRRVIDAPRQPSNTNEGMEATKKAPTTFGKWGMEADELE
jgi:hypothetical protein